MKFIVTNQNKAERLVRLIVSIFLLPAPFIYQNNPFAMLSDPDMRDIMAEMMKGMSK